MSGTPLGITVTRTLGGGRRVEVWDFDYWKRAGLSPGPYVMVAMDTGPDPMLGIDANSTPSTIDLGLRLFQKFRAGAEIEPTHTMVDSTWPPELVPIGRPPDPEALFDLGGAA